MTDSKEKPKLVEQIEKIIESAPSADSLDPDLATYLNQFLEDFNALQELPPIDLRTPESAREAMVMLDAKKSELAAKLKVAQSLTKLLNNSK